jgi:hypothetical protein
VPVTPVSSLPEAVAAAVAMAQAGDRVLLSPACPYFFRLYYLEDGAEEQGFRALLRGLTAAAAPARQGALDDVGT